MFPWFCLFSLSFQWEEVQKFSWELFFLILGGFSPSENYRFWPDLTHPRKHPEPRKWGFQKGFLLKKGLLQKSDGNFSGQMSGWILRGIFRCSFWGLFPWKKPWKKSTEKSTGKFKIEFGSFAAKIHTARICPWVFAKVYGCGALSAKSTAGSNTFGYFCFPGRGTGLCKNPLC